MLPYTPLHHLLMQELGFPVVATSGNLSDEPICIDEHEALERLRGIADLFLVHDRPILRHVDDSMVRVMAGRELVLRRARGFAPLPVMVDDELPRVLAVGAHQKNAVAASVGQPGFHQPAHWRSGDRSERTGFRAVIADLEISTKLRPRPLPATCIPNYFSTQYARNAKRVERRFAVQHHYAHALACMAENQLAAPALGIAWDGSGYGPGRTVWGGEFLRIIEDGFDAVARLRHFRLPGSEARCVNRGAWRLAILREAFGRRGGSGALTVARAGVRSRRAPAAGEMLRRD